jgi:ubiquitin-small subunit ribosomal protein S27Ae
MATKSEGASKDKKGKKEHKNKLVSKKYSLYNGTTKKNKFCPRCGPGVFLASHDNRVHCGKCGYTEFKAK